MREQFVSFEIAQLMQQKGFDDKCFTFYRKDGILAEGAISYMGFHNSYKDVYDYEAKKNNILKDFVTAPLWQQTLDWLRDVKGIFIDLTLHDRENTETWKYEISEYGYYNMLAQENVYQSYYNTREIAIKKALELI